MGGLLSRVSNLLRRDDYIGEVVYIHGRPYRFERRLGSGSFGSVYSASRFDGMFVAIKVINLAGLPPNRSQKLVQTYLNEVYLLERLRQESRHVVYIHDFDFDPRSGRAFIVMELGGENLMTLINRSRANGPSLDPFLIKAFWRQMVSIVYTLHINGIVHMDLKPANLILFGPTLKIADLGISRKVNVLGQARSGTPFFSAPEVMQDIAGLQRFYGTKADIWSLGAILYFMVYGLPPPYQQFAANPPPGQYPHPDPELNDILRRTLVLNPQVRADIETVLYHPFTES